jgi:hypothetical protein
VQVVPPVMVAQDKGDVKDTGDERDELEELEGVLGPVKQKANEVSEAPAAKQQKVKDNKDLTINDIVNDTPVEQWGVGEVKEVYKTWLTENTQPSDVVSFLPVFCFLLLRLVFSEMRNAKCCKACLASDMICFLTLPCIRCLFCKSGKCKCQDSVKAPRKLGKVEVKVPEEKVVKVEKSKEKPKAVPKKIVAKSSAPLPLQTKHKPGAVAGPSQFTGLMPAGVHVVQAGVASPLHFRTGISLSSKEIPHRYTRGWDFEAVGEDGELSLEMIC